MNKIEIKNQNLLLIKKNWFSVFVDQIDRIIEQQRNSKEDQWTQMRMFHFIRNKKWTRERHEINFETQQHKNTFRMWFMWILWNFQVDFKKVWWSHVELDLRAIMNGQTWNTSLGSVSYCHSIKNYTSSLTFWLRWKFFVFFGAVAIFFGCELIYFCQLRN